MIRMLLLVILLPFGAWAQGMPQPLSDTVSDFAGVLNAAEKADLTTTLKKARDETGVQIVVVVMEARALYGGAGQSIETYAKNLFNGWGVGDKTRNDGVMILVARQDREMRIALGAGYDAVYDGLAQRVIDREMLPEFRNNRFAQGIKAGTQAVIDRIARPFASHNPPPQQSDYSRILGILPFLLFAVACCGVAFGSQIGDVAIRFRACPNCGQRSLSRSRKQLTQATEFMRATGVQTTLCRTCGYKHEEPHEFPRISSSSGSDSSGFGGGRSSGGGASGRW
ncbi:TPM domain-containing protein [Cypionkella sinensis]|uniref:TPM domain-containing protein n=1 Tax=Cypionkella sinensis TaxID=1756043 RepID=A0ABV7IZB7_9RHOB